MPAKKVAVGSSLRFDEARKGVERRLADMMLDAFSVAPGSIGIDPQCQKKSFDDMMASPARFGERLAGFCQKDATIGALRHETFVGETFQHLGDGRLSDAQARSNIDLPGFAAIADQIGDQLDIILDQFEPPCLARLPETLDMHDRVDQAGFGGVEAPRSVSCRLS